jgi:hypothetical protein
MSVCGASGWFRIWTTRLTLTAILYIARTHDFNPTE